ncbi:hypothetical protein ACFVUN_01400 [Kitasatospora griseola]|uniref:hypothetical protein n=1 Tax=Kitasatospora griseola TaxID=2064 RepID=UPI0036DDA0E8
MPAAEADPTTPGRRAASAPHGTRTTRPRLPGSAPADGTRSRARPPEAPRTAAGPVPQYVSVGSTLTVREAV